MTTSRQNSSARTTTSTCCTVTKSGQVKILVTVTALLSEIICGGQQHQVQAFLMPVGFTSLQQQQQQVHNKHKHSHAYCRTTSPRFAVYYSEDGYEYNEDQWGDNNSYSADYYEQQQQQQQQQQQVEYDYGNFNDDAYNAAVQQRKDEGSIKRAILGGAALGTLMAINNAVDMSAGASEAIVEQAIVVSEVQPVKSVSLNAQPAVTLPYLEKQIQAAEEAIAASASSVVVATSPEATTTTVVAAAAPLSTASFAAPVVATSPQATTTVAAAAPLSTASFAAPVVATSPQATTTVAAAAPLSTTSFAAPVVTTSPQATTTVAAAAPLSTATFAAPVVATSPQATTTVAAAAPLYTVVASPQATTTVAKTSATKIEETSPSFLRYTQEHIPGWIETGQKVYDATKPKVVAGGQKLAAEVDKRVTPKIIETEHQLLGDENSAVLDKTLTSVASAGKMVAGMVGKVISFGIEGGIQIAKATPEVIAAGQQVYKTVDEKILPEVVDTSRRMKMIIDTTVPEVFDAGKHAYDTIMPEVMNAEKQIASTVQGGVDIISPKVKEIENKIVPEFSQMQRNVLGYERAAMLDKTMAEAAQQGQSAFKTVGKTIPEVFASGQKTVNGVATTGRTVARAVPVLVETGKQAYGTVDKSIAGAISTTRDIGSDLDRAGGKAAYALEENLFGVAGTIDRTLPSLLETGRQVASTVPEIAKTVESGSRAIYDDVSGYVDDLKVQKTIDSAGKRFAATKSQFNDYNYNIDSGRKAPPTFQDFTASVNDPNELGKL